MKSPPTEGDAVGERVCYRCDRVLPEVHRIRLSAEHEGRDATAYVDVEKFCCPDCAAGIGLLELSKEHFRKSEPAADERGVLDRFRIDRP